MAWLNASDNLDLILKAGVAHLWFVTIHPFEDGNGRIARVITDYLLTQADNIPQRFYSMSAQIRTQRKSYYDELERTQKGDLEITNWLVWFLNCLQDALHDSLSIVEKIQYKHQFWIIHADKNLNERQRKMLNKLLNDFYGKLTTRKWAKMTKCSHDTALRDIQHLIAINILRQTTEGGRSTNYELIGLKKE